MPLTAFVGPNGEDVSLEEAPEYFDRAGIMPAAAVKLVIEDESRQHTLPVVNPSFVAPSVNCRRKLILQKHTPYKMSPLGRWAAEEGTNYHNMLGTMQREGWHNEVYLPNQDGEDDAHPKVKVVEAPWGKTIRLAEVFPGWWTRARLDLASPDWREIHDYKSSKYPWTPRYKGDPKLTYENQDSRTVWPLQLNVEAQLVELLRDVRPEELFVWRVFRGSQRPEDAWRKIPVARLSAERLWALIGEHVLSTQWALERAAVEGADVLDVARGVPADGRQKNMFNGWLCREGCPVSQTCLSLDDGVEY